MKRVLVIEHDPRLSSLYTQALERVAFEVHRARDAQTAVELLDTTQADVIVLDLGLPGHSGFEVLHELQSYDDWHAVPVVALTNVQPEHYPITKKTWRRYGVVEVLYRPDVRPHELAERLKTISKRKV